MSSRYNPYDGEAEGYARRGAEIARATKRGEVLPAEVDPQGVNILDGRQRCSDVERERFTAELRDHYAEGRIGHAEFDAREEAVRKAETVSQLGRLLDDLGGFRLPREPRRERGKRAARAALRWLPVLYDKSLPVRVAVHLAWLLVSSVVIAVPATIIGLTKHPTPVFAGVCAGVIIIGVVLVVADCIAAVVAWDKYQ